MIWEFDGRLNKKNSLVFGKDNCKKELLKIKSKHKYRSFNK